MRQIPEPAQAKAELTLRRLSIKATAEAIGMSPAYVGRCLNGWVPPSERLVEALAKLLDLPPERLFGPEMLQHRPNYPGDRLLNGRDDELAAS